MFSTKKTFIEKLRDKLNDAEIQAKIQHNSGDRIFDGLPEAFDTVFSDTAVDAAELGQLLKNIPANHIATEDGHVFRLKSDTDKIECWAKRLIARTSRELLNDDNSIKESLLNLLNKTNETLSARDLVRAYYSAATQYITTLVNQSDDARYINIYVLQAFIEYNASSGSKWILSVLHDRTTDPNINYNERDTGVLTDDNNFDLSMGLLGGVVGGLCMLGLAGGIVAYQIYKNRQNKSADHLPETDTRESRSPSHGR